MRRGRDARPAISYRRAVPALHAFANPARFLKIARPLTPILLWLGIALVMDEYGSFEGLVTAADVLEAIVGDPSDTDSPTPVAGIAETTLIADGMMPVDELKARLGLPDLPAEGSYHTLAGLILALLRRVPRTGDRIVFGGWRFEVLEMDGRRVEKVRATVEPAAEG